MVKTDSKTRKNCKIWAFCITFLMLFFVSCKAEINLYVQKDGSVIISFEGNSGEYFEKMIRNFAGTENDNEVFNAAQIKESFINEGFKNVSVSVPSSTGLAVKLLDDGKSFLFSSGILRSDKKNIYINLSPSLLQNFYNSASEDIVTILDLFLAPVFNDEEMSVEEYLEVVGSFYGDDASKEISDAKINLTLVSSDGKKREVVLPLVKVLTLTENLSF